MSEHTTCPECLGAFVARDRADDGEEYRTGPPTVLKGPRTPLIRCERGHAWEVTQVVKREHMPTAYTLGPRRSDQDQLIRPTGSG